MKMNSANSFQPHLIVRLIPAAYKRELIPSAVQSEEEAIEFAIDRSKHWDRKVCLSWEEEMLIWIRPDRKDWFKTQGAPPSTRIK